MYPVRISKKFLLFLLVFGLVLGSSLTQLKNGYSSARANSLSNTGGLNSGQLMAANAPLASTVDIQVAAGNNDVEQRVSDGYMYLDSSDLELTNDPGVAKGNQTVGMRFTGLNIPRGSTISQAYLEFQVDETSSEATSLAFHAQAADNAAAFSTAAYNVSSRAKTAAAMSWNNIPAWNTVGAKVQSPDLSTVIQEVVNRTGWTSGNSLVIIVDGSGRRVASAYEAGAGTAAKLHIVYNPAVGSPTPTLNVPTATRTSTPVQPTLTRTPTSTNIPATNTPAPTNQGSVIDIRVTTGNDDVEQRVSDGYIYLGSTDLELTNDPGVAKGNQTVGMRFNSVSIPRGSTITQAYLEFQVDETSSEATSLVFHAQAADNAAAFSTTAYNVSSRAKTASAMSWNNIPAWSTVGAKVQSPDLSNVVQEVVNRTGWSSGNSLVIIADGSGRRVASAYETGAGTAARLHVAFLNGGGPTSTPGSTATRTPTSTSLPTTPTRTPTTQPPTPTRTATSRPPTATSTPTSTQPAPQPTPVGQAGNWNMVFNDEFNGNNLDSSKWRTCFWWADTTCSIETNHELELYNPEDVLVQNGLLRLRAQHRDMVAWNGVTYHYTSGMIMTGGRSGQIPPEFKFTYGYAEARVKVPAGKGLWPAFWMLPVSYNSRPEIDIMEILGDTTSAYHMNYHYTGGDAGSTWNGPDFSAGWHVIGVDWEPSAIVWYVDGVERWRFADQAHISNEPEYLLLNLAVGGDWPGPPDGNTPFPSYFEVDYVRVWQK